MPPAALVWKFNKVEFIDNCDSLIYFVNVCKEGIESIPNSDTNLPDNSGQFWYGS